MHGQNMMHRDLKAANVLVGKDAAGIDTAKLCDLGLALQVRPNGVHTPDCGTQR